MITAATTLGHIAQRPRRTEVRDRIALAVRQHVVGHGHQRILLDKHRAVLAHEGQPVDVGIDHHAQIGLLADDRRGDLRQVLGQRFRIVGELARRLAVEFHDLAAQLAQQLRDHDASHRVDGVDHHLEAFAPHSVDIDQRQGEHPTDMFVVERFARKHMPQCVDLGKFEVASFGQLQHALALGIGEELAVGIEQFQRVPLARIVRGGNDDAAVGLVGRDGQLHAGRRAEPHVDHVGAAAEQGALDQVAHHFARKTCVAADDDPQAALFALAQKTDVGSGEFHDVERGQIVARAAADRTADTRDGFDECHV